MLVFVFDRKEIAFFDDFNWGTGEMISPEPQIPPPVKFNILKFMLFRLVFLNGCSSSLSSIHLISFRRTGYMDIF